MVSFDKSPYRTPGPSEEGEEGGTSMAGSTEANVMVNRIGRMMDLVSRLPRADKASRHAFAAVDVAGYNYGTGRYRHDVKAYPRRVILSSETLPGDVARAWQLATERSTGEPGEVTPTARTRSGLRRTPAARPRTRHGSRADPGRTPQLISPTTQGRAA